ncbi:MAG: YrdB family protein [Chloroflexota bacterium]|nr:YrdB family protein [Chloroflexota bacterium]
MRNLNLGIRFILELCALSALGYWGFTSPDGLVAKVIVGTGTPLLPAVGCGLVVAPRAPLDVPGTVRFAVELAVFLAAILALAATEHVTLAVVLGLAYVVNRSLLWVARPGR